MMKHLAQKHLAQKHLTQAHAQLLALVAAFLLFPFACTAQQSLRTGNRVGGGCDGCEIMFVGMPAQLKSTDTSIAWRDSREQAPKLLVVGRVFQRDGKTPAANVILYYWHTNSTGRYTPDASIPNGSTQSSVRHGRIRGWMKTDAQGRYALYTRRPAPYPNESLPAHIHFTVKEPSLPNEYYIDDVVFDDDPLLTPAKRSTLENRGGNGIARLTNESGLFVANRIIVLGLNIPNYPATAPTNSTRSRN